VVARPHWSLQCGLNISNVVSNVVARPHWSLQCGLNISNVVSNVAQHLKCGLKCGSTSQMWSQMWPQHFKTAPQQRWGQASTHSKIVNKGRVFVVFGASTLILSALHSASGCMCPPYTHRLSLSTPTQAPPRNKSAPLQSLKPPL
jgi:hypothetical protein